MTRPGDVRKRPSALRAYYVETGVFDVALLHNRYTLLNIAASPLWDLAAKRNVAAVNAAPYGGGILSKGPDANPTYAYKPASANLLARARRIEELCARYRIPLGAAALQFSLRDPRVASSVVGISRPERLDQTVALARHPIPEEFWSTMGAISSDTEDLG